MGLRKRKDERKALKGSSSRKKKTKFSKPVFYNDAIKERWDPTKSFAKNYSSMGIVMSVNQSVRTGLNNNKKSMNTSMDSAKTSHFIDSISASFDAPKNGDESKAPCIVLGNDAQRYAANLIESHGDNYLAMFRDVETNFWQYTESKCRKLCQNFLLLDPCNRKVPVPEYKKKNLL